jgi:8-oxo-dGTP diphosphatase
VKKVLEVCCGIVEEAGKIYSFRRGGGMKMPGKWEFPGGKVEAGESAESALHRELLEELQIKIEILERKEAVQHDYPEFTIHLIPFRVQVVEGTIQLLEHDALQLGTIKELIDLDWADADRKIIEMLMR